MRPRVIRLCVMAGAVMALLAAPIGAQDGPPTMCETKSWTIYADFYDVVNCDYPTGMNGGDDLVADPTGNCTGVQYSIQGNKPIAHSAVLAYNPSGPYDAFDEDFPAAGPSTGSNFVNARCDGDQTTDTGIGSCHEQAIRYNPEGDATGPFWFVVYGVREFSTTTVTLKGNKIEQCEILGVGDEMTLDQFPSNCVPSCGNFDEKQSIVKTEIIQFEDCFVRFEYDTTTGEIFDYGLAQVCDPDLPDCCDVSVGCQGGTGDQACCDSPDFPTFDICDAFEIDVEDLSLTADNIDLDGVGGMPSLGLDVPLGDGQFGDGYISTGSESCSCRVFAGRVFCWGSPCPAYSTRR